MKHSSRNIPVLRRVKKHQYLLYIIGAAISFMAIEKIVPGSDYGLFRVTRVAWLCHFNQPLIKGILGIIDKLLTASIFVDFIAKVIEAMKEIGDIGHDPPRLVMNQVIYRYHAILILFIVQSLLFNNISNGCN